MQRLCRCEDADTQGVIWPLIGGIGGRKEKILPDADWKFIPLRDETSSAERRSAARKAYSGMDARASGPHAPVDFWCLRCGNQSTCNEGSVPGSSYGNRFLRRPHAVPSISRIGGLASSGLRNQLKLQTTVSLRHLSQPSPGLYLMQIVVRKRPSRLGNLATTRSSAWPVSIHINASSVKR